MFNHNVHDRYTSGILLFCTGSCKVIDPSDILKTRFQIVMPYTAMFPAATLLVLQELHFFTCGTNFDHSYISQNGQPAEGITPGGKGGGVGSSTSNIKC